MANQRSNFLVGLFMISGLAIGLVAIILLGMSHFFEKGRFYASYFDQSVQGLDVDSPVKYRGVAVGRVERIAVSPDSRLITVIMKIDEDMKLEKDMVAQLTVVGITGSMFIELDRRKKDEPDRTPHLSFPSEYPIVASKPSEISELFHSIDEIMQQFHAMDLPGISDRAKLTLDSLNKTLTDMDTKGISGDLKKTIANLNQNLDSKRWDAIFTKIEAATGALQGAMTSGQGSMLKVDKVIDRVDAIISTNEKTINTALLDIHTALDNISTMMQKVSTLADGTGSNIDDLNQRLIPILNNLENAGEKLNRGIEQFTVQPSQLIYGSPPPERVIKEKK